jgi:NhaP-type Na+/H+ or K+/H+ antiporter
MQHTAALTIAIALASGVITQALAFHVRVPGIVLLLGTGFLLGPELAGLVRPATLGSGLMTLVGFAVAVILFEGGMNLNLARLRREQRLIRRLVLWGGPMTALGGALAAFAFLQWDLRTSLLFGTLVMVTGPTVITPLLRRIRVSQSLATVLEAEGVIIDAFGALVAVITLEILLNPSGRSLAMGLAELPVRIGTGLLVGLAGGALTALLLRAERLVPERLGNVFALAMALVAFQTSNALISESGLVAAIAAGIVVGNVRTRVLRDLREFKEQLTMMFIGMLFVLLSASVRLEDLRALGWGGLLTVLALMVFVRPVVVWLCTHGSELGWREKAFLGWLAPRGIVAAAVSAMFAQSLESAGMPGGPVLRAMVFLVIVTTVVVQGLPAGLVVRLLGLRQRGDATFILVGANALGRLLARGLGTASAGTVLIDAAPDTCHVAEEAGFRVLYGSGLEERTLRRAGIDSARNLIAITKNEGVNVLCAHKAIDDFRIRRAYAGIDRRRIGISESALSEGGVRTLFGAPRDLRHWITLCERGAVVTEFVRRASRGQAGDPRGEGSAADRIQPLFLPLVVSRSGRRFPVDERWSPRLRDELWVAIARDRREEALAWLAENGWKPTEPSRPAGDAPSDDRPPQKSKPPGAATPPPTSDR